MGTNIKIVVLMAVILLLPYSVFATGLGGGGTVNYWDISKWDAESNFSLALNSGNNDFLTMGTNNSLMYTPSDKYRLETSLEAFSTRSDGSTTAEWYSFDLKGEQEINRGYGGYLEAAWYRNRLSGIRNQENGAIGLWAERAIPYETIEVYGGLQYRYESRLGESVKQSPMAELGLNYYYKLNYLTKLGSEFESAFDLDDTKNWELDWKAIVAFQLTDKVSVETSYAIKHRNDPISNFGPTDRMLMNTVKIDW